MTSIGSPSPFFLAGKKTYIIDHSLRFNRDDPTYLNRTPSSSSISTKATLSFWFKPSTLISGTNGGNFFAKGNTSYVQYFNESLYIGNSSYWMNTASLLRDFSAWYHAVVVIDTTEGTATNRQKIYLNNVLQARGSTVSDPAQNANYDFLNDTSEYFIGKRSSGQAYHGYMAEINFVDGLAYDPSYFGETDAITGQWNPKKYVGSYGTNGFYLSLSDNSGTTATTLGKDSSGNGNNWTPNNFVTGDAVKDSPTNNFPTWNPISSKNIPTLLEGNLENYGNNNTACNATFGVKSGKWYWEMHILTDVSTTGYIAGTGVTAYEMENDGDVVPRLNYDTSKRSFYRAATSGGYYDYKRYTDTNGTAVNSGGTFYGGAVISFRLDMDNGTLKYYTNNTLVHTDSTIPTDGTVIFPMQNATNSGVSRHNTSIINFGQDGTFAGNKTAQGNADENGIGNFFYPVPSGFKAICSKNLPDPTIKLPNQHFDVVRYVGNVSTNAITSYQFAPDFVWIKNNDLANESSIHDTLRGPNKALRTVYIGNEQASAENDALVSFDSNGFTLGDNSSSPQPDINNNVSNYTSYGWNGGGAASKTYKVKVVADSTDYGHGTGSNKYQFFKSDGTTGFGTNGVDLDLEEGGTYIFDWSDSSAQTHPIRFSLTNDGTHSSGTSAGTEYTTGVVKDDSAYKTTITIASGVANLFYYCQSHSGMGAEINTNTTKGSTNFDGSTLSVVKANPSGGFSIVAYTGNGSTSASTTIGHGLGVSPDVIITKMRTATGTDFGWSTWHHKLLHASYGQDVGIWLDKTNGQNADMWDGYSNFSSTVFTPADLNYNNVNTAKYINYVFSEVEGYSKFGSYEGNGSSDGPFAFCGFRPAYLLVKIFSTTQAWTVVDVKRDAGNPSYYEFYPDLVQGDGTYTGFDLLSNGFKARGTNTWQNQSGQSFIFIAFAESPFKYARAR